MGYTVSVGKVAPFLDQTGTPIPNGAIAVSTSPTGVVKVATAPSTGGPGLQGLTVGTTNVTVTPNGGSPVVHQVTVVAAVAPFDWTLGAEEDPAP